MYNLSSQKQRKFRLQMNENRFQLYEKLFRLPEIIEFLNYLKITLKGPLSILQKWRFTTYSLGSWSLHTSQKEGSFLREQKTVDLRHFRDF